MRQIINSATMDAYLFDDLLEFFKQLVELDIYNEGESKGWADGFDAGYEEAKVNEETAFNEGYLVGFKEGSRVKEDASM